MFVFEIQESLDSLMLSLHTLRLTSQEQSQQVQHIGFSNLVPLTTLTVTAVSTFTLTAAA